MPHASLKAIRPTAGGVVTNTAGEIIVVQNRRGWWSLPKGGIEAGETPLTAARREIREETGVTDLTLIKELGTYERTTKKRKSITIFLFSSPTITLKPEDKKHPVARWVSIDEAVSLLSHPLDKAFLTSIRSKISPILKHAA